MADSLLSQPVRTDLDGDVVSKICDATTPSQQLKVYADGSIDVKSVLNAVALDAPTLAALESITVQNGAGGAAVNVQDGGNSLTVDAVDLDIRDLVFATDKVDASGSVVALDAPTLAALESITVQNGAGGAAVNIQDGGNSITVDAIDLDIRNLDKAQDSVKADMQVGGVDVSNSNPVPVALVSEQLGDTVVDYHTTSAVAVSASVTYDYAVTAAKIFHLEKVIGTHGGKIKMEVQVSPDGVSFSTKAVLFSSASFPMCDYHLGKDMFVPVTGAGSKVRVIITNLDNKASNVYCTIHGLEL